MNELIMAAKAVIDAPDIGELWDALINLQAAVERAAKPSDDFMKWWRDSYPINKFGIVPAFHGWQAGQQAERERIKKIITESREMKVIGKDWLLRQIDAGE